MISDSEQEDPFHGDYSDVDRDYVPRDATEDSESSESNLNENKNKGKKRLRNEKK